MKIAKFSRLGFILAASGSAVGLGNIWKFPYITGEFGGGAFVLIYLLAVAFIGFSVMIGEMFIGYEAKKDTVSSFEELSPTNKHIWKFGGFQAFTGLLIMTFYSVVIGWIIHYVVTSIVALPTSVSEAESAFMGMLTTGIYTQLFYHTISAIFITYIVTRGIKGGIEKLNMVLMPLLMIILFGMFAYATTLGAFSQAVEFMFSPDFSKINSEAFVSAIGHAFFTLSLGMGAIMTYSASLEKNSNLVKSALWVILLDTTIAIVAGLMLFTFLYQYGASPSKGPGLVFISLPAVFYEMGVIGNLFAIIFFISLAFAGLTSSVSIVEPTVQYLINRFGFSRLKATISIGTIFYLIGIVALLSNIEGFKESLTFGSKNIFDWLDFITASILLPLGGLVIALFMGFVVEKNRVESVLKPQLGSAFELWYFSIKYLTPMALFIVMLNLVGIF